MGLSNQQGIEEVFVIKTEEIDFFGALVKEKEGRSAVNGRVWFRDGTRWHFQSPAGNRVGLRMKLVSLCETIATFYSADVFRLKFHRVVAYEEFIHILQKTKQGTAYA